jgi:hypothetical protein
MQSGDSELFATGSLARSNPPSEFSAAWVPLFETLTGADSANDWGLRAAIAITRYRKTHHQGPTFAELFAALEISAMPGPYSDVASATKSAWREVYQFRRHVAVHWRRLGWIQWDHRARSLRVGRAFSVASHLWVSTKTHK